MTRDDPNWPRASAWLAGDHFPDPRTRLAVFGVPVKRGSLSGGRFDLAPRAIREALARFSTYDTELDVDVRAVGVGDRLDLPLDDVPLERLPVDIAQPIMQALLEMGAVALLGGDNSITRAGCHAVAPTLDRLGVVTLDAHHDLRDTGEGLNNGNPIRALLDDGFPGRNIVQIGIQSFANSAAYAEVARKAGIGVIPVAEVRRRGIVEVVSDALDGLSADVDLIYVDLDVDVLDRAFAPACPGARPGGLMPWELQAAARTCGRHPKVRAIDIVEVDPERDIADVTVMTAASCLLAFAAGLAARPPS